MQSRLQLHHAEKPRRDKNTVHVVNKLHLTSLLGQQQQQQQQRRLFRTPDKHTYNTPAQGTGPLPVQLPPNARHDDDEQSPSTRNVKPMAARPKLLGQQLDWSSQLS